jgi:hypothetical protein
MRSIALVALSVALSSPAMAERRGGPFPAGERYQEPLKLAPAQESRFHVQAVDLTSGPARVSVTATGTGRLLVWTMPVAGSRMQSSLRAPDGRALGAAESRSALQDLGRAGFSAPDLGLSLDARHEVLFVEKPAAGAHEIDLEGEGAAIVVSAEPESTLTLATAAGPLSRQPGEPVVLRAELRDGDTPVLGATVSARLAAGRAAGGPSITLRDDGRSQDGAANDGVYGAVVRGASSAPGPLDVRFEARGTDTRGSAFARTGGSGLINEPGVARLTDVTARVLPGRGLLVTGTADVKAAGRFRLDVTVAGPADADGARPALAWSEEYLRLAPGRQRVQSLIPAAQVPGLGVDPLRVDVRLLGYDPVGLAGLTVLDVR